MTLHSVTLNCYIFRVPFGHGSKILNISFVNKKKKTFCFNFTFELVQLTISHFSLSDVW